MSPPARIVLHDVAVEVAGRALVRHLDWRLAAGESWLLTGPSGSGKTLLAQVLCGRLRPGRGTLSYRSPDGSRSSPFPDDATLPRRAIVYAGTDNQRRSLGPECFYQARWNSLANDTAPRVADALEPAALFAVSPFQILGPTDVPPDFAARRAAAIAAMRLEPLLARTLPQLSSGERRRLLLAQALARAPQALLLDDPFDGLDSAFRQRLREVVATLVADSGLMALLITPRPEDADGLTCRTLRLDGHGGWHIGPQRTAVAPPQHPGATAPEHSPTTADVTAPPASAANVTRHTNRPTATPTLCLRGVTVRYGATTILDHVDWQVGPDEHWLIAGPNGSGKTTLLALLCRDTPQAYAQDITVLGHQTTDGLPLARWRRPIGLVSPELLLNYPLDTPCREVVLSGFDASIGCFRLPTPAETDAVNAMLRRLELDTLADEPLGDIPEGAQRLALLGRALIKSPRLLLLDEPCQGLDPDQRRRLHHWVDAAAQDGAQVLYVSHHHDEVPRCLTHALVLEEGRVRSAGLLHQP